MCVLLFDTAGDFEGDFEGAGCLVSADFGAGACACAGVEIGNFAEKGLSFFDSNGFTEDFFSGELGDDGGVVGGKKFCEERGFLCGVVCEPVGEAFLFLVVEREVGVWLKDSDFSQPLRTDSRHRDIGDTAVGEADSCVCDVLSFAEDGNSHCVDGLHF